MREVATHGPHLPRSRFCSAPGARQAFLSHSHRPTDSFCFLVKLRPGSLYGLLPSRVKSFSLWARKGPRVLAPCFPPLPSLLLSYSSPLQCLLPDGFPRSASATSLVFHFNLFTVSTTYLLLAIPRPLGWLNLIG